MTPLKALVICTLWFHVATGKLADYFDVAVSPKDGVLLLVGQTKRVSVNVPSMRGQLCAQLRTHQHQPFYDVTSSKQCVNRARKRNTASGTERLNFMLRGIKPGRRKTQLLVYSDQNLSNISNALHLDYDVIVTHKTNLLHDAFAYVLASMHLMTLLLLSMRMRVTSAKEAVSKPGAFIIAVTCQLVCLPLVSAIIVSILQKGDNCLRFALRLF